MTTTITNTEAAGVLSDKQIATITEEYAKRWERQGSWNVRRCIQNALIDARSLLAAASAQATGLIDQHHHDSAELRKLCEARDEARRTAEHWKAEHLAGNKEIKRLQAIIAAVPEGWKLVPVDPTVEMLAALADTGNAPSTRYADMLTAAPTAPQPPATAPVIDKSMVKRLATQFGLIPEGDERKDSLLTAVRGYLQCIVDQSMSRNNAQALAAEMISDIDAALSQPKQEG